MSLKKSKTSFLWQFFEKVDHSFATCNICKTKISYKTSTSNLKRHMIRRHPTVQLEELVDKPQPIEIDITEEQPSTSSAAPKRMTQCKIIKNYRPISKEGLNIKLLQLFTIDLQPFSVVDDRGFREFVKSLNPMYVLPSRRVVSKTMIPALYEECRHKMQGMIQGGNQFCITTDCWTSRNVCSFIAVTAHFVSPEFELKSILLSASELNINHTAENLANAIYKIVCDWNVERKILLSVSDNASNIKCALTTKLNWKHFGCMAHTMNLIVKDGLRVTEVAEIIDKIKGIVTYFKKSSSANEAFLSYQRNSGRDPLKLIQQVETRWNSTLAMMERFAALEEAVKCTLVILNRSLLTLSSEEWQIVKDLCIICQPFKDATVTISGETYCTGSLVIPITNGLQDVYRHLLTKVWPDPVRKVIDIFVNGIRERLGNIQKSNTFSVATFLDPRFKL
ncbi:E3 SUMO-protein ligase ZBED1-like [Eurosta solidaginis]|uniref:E3 SUMO-protein ligase ZBED1-like n=1 Tax=Eurosta solidaginis TaxID=178769 RepID=UPI0035311E8D